MILLSVNAVRKHFGPEPVLQGLTFEIRPGDKVGLVGPNGTGKSTLLKILVGQLEPDSGTVQVHASATIGYLEQQPEFVENRTVWQEAQSALGRLVNLSAEAERLARLISAATDEAERRQFSRRFDQVQQELQLRDAFHLDHKIERVLHGLGFADACFEQPVPQLSGGQQNRLLLVKLLLSAPDVMLLDEPSNHLDIDATRWLEDYLSSSNQAMLVVSHDRFLLDKVTTRTLELFRGTTDAYKGNFSAYVRQKAERLEVERRTYENQRQEIAKLEDFVRRNHYGQKHAQAKDRRKKLERIQRVDPPREISTAPMGFPATSRIGDIAMRVEHLSKSFDRTLFRDLTFDILRGQRWGILGENGAGKTTLLRCLLQPDLADEGKVVHGQGVRIGYFDQLLAGLDADLQLIDAVRPGHREFVEQQRRDMLARFGITGDMVFQPVKSVSGGERNRVALARLAAMEANFLVLDEPTNHLDLWARATLERSLKAFDGTILFVSHDRYFVNQVADHLLVICRGQVQIVHGNYDTFVQLSDTAGRDPQSDGSCDTSFNATHRAVPARTNSAKSRRRRRFPYRKVEDIEAEIFEHERQLEQLHAQLSLPDNLRDGTRVKQIQAHIGQCKDALSRLYEHWDEATELN